MSDPHQSEKMSVIKGSFFSKFWQRYNYSEAPGAASLIVSNLLVWICIVIAPMAIHWLHGFFYADDSVYKFDVGSFIDVRLYVAQLVAGLVGTFIAVMAIFNSSEKVRYWAITLYGECVSILLNFGSLLIAVTLVSGMNFENILLRLGGGFINYAAALFLLRIRHKKFNHEHNRSACN